MKKSEKVLMVITIIAGLIFIIAKITGSGSSSVASGDDIDTLEKDYNLRIKQLRTAPATYREFYRLVGQDADTTINPKTARPDLDFQADVAQWCKNYGFNAPNIEKDVENIKDVEDYQLVIVRVSIRDADFHRIAQLLKDFESYGLIIQEVDLQNRNDRELLSTATIAVARLVPHFMDKVRRR